MGPSQKPRLFFIDNLRWLMIVFVVLMHVNVTYSMIGGWYYIEETELDIFQTIYFGIYGSFTQAYFMGLLFFISGYFVTSSYDRKGFGRFTRERSIRLGIPTLIYMLLIHPLNIFILDHYQHWDMNFASWYLDLIRKFRFIEASGPLWFALALLIFSILYAILRKSGIVRKRPEAGNSVLRHRQILGTALFLSAFTFATRIIFPIGSSILNMQLCFFPQYILLFILGIIFFRRDLLSSLSYRTGIVWFRYTLILGIPLWFLIMSLGNVPEKGFQVLSGHLTWMSAAYSTWESFFCVGVCLGLIVIFREKVNHQGRLSRFLSSNAFGVYVFHAPVLIFISMLMKNVDLYPFFKYLIVAVITLPASFTVSYLVRRIPGVAYIIK